LSISAEESDAHDGRFCWQQIVKVRPHFRLSYPYAPKSYAEKIRALYALLAALEESVSQVSDEVVSNAKLSWWIQQLFDPDYADSAHPVTRQLHRFGLISESTKGAYRDLISMTMNRMDSPPAVDEEALKGSCHKLGQKQMAVELLIQDETSEQSEITHSLCAMNGLLQLLRESSHGQLYAYGWVPLNLLARCEVSRSELQSGSKPEHTAKLIRNLAITGLSWSTGAAVTKGDEWMHQLDAGWRRRHRHWLLQTAVNERILAKLSSAKQNRQKDTIFNSGPGDAWFSWRCARQLTKRSD
jgi:phytoene/squalene synthetase